MSKTVELAFLALGGISLFVVAFLGFAVSGGVPLQDVAVIGPLLEQDVEPTTTTEPVEVAPDPARPRSDFEVLRSNAGILSAYSLPSPFDGGELQELADELSRRKQDLDEREDRIAERELQVQEREDSAAEQFRTLQEMRNGLEALEADLEARASEVARDESASAENEQSGWRSRAELFADGDAEELSGRLTQYEPEEAARILHQLESERATELLNALPASQWKTYVDAYTALPD